MTHEQELDVLLKQAKKALNGESNDAEHEALFELVEYLSKQVAENPATAPRKRSYSYDHV